MSTAKELRQQFRAIPKATRDERQGFAIRVWRGLSWLERAEGLDNKDIEGRFISCWIGFNSLYGQQDQDGRPWGEREAWGTFLAKIWQLDQDEKIRRVLGARQLNVLKMIEDKYLSRAFWQEGEPACTQAKKELRQALNLYGTLKMLPVLQLLMERLYVMRLQIFHGASTKGSSLNRRALQRSATLLQELLAAMLTVMIDHGVDEDYGELCFAPNA